MSLDKLSAWRSDLDAAWSELIDGWHGWHSRNQLGELARHRQPIVEIRCRTDNSLAAAVWRTSHGLLYVVAGRTARRTSAEPWEPIRALANYPEVPELEAVPPPCPSCMRRLALDWSDLQRETGKARRGKPRCANR